MTNDRLHKLIASNSDIIALNTRAIKLLSEENSQLTRENRAWRYELRILGDPQEWWNKPIGELLKRRGR